MAAVCCLAAGRCAAGATAAAGAVLGLSPSACRTRMLYSQIKSLAPTVCLTGRKLPAALTHGKRGGGHCSRARAEGNRLHRSTLGAAFKARS